MRGLSKIKRILSSTANQRPRRCNLLINDSFVNDTSNFPVLVMFFSREVCFSSRNQ